MKYLKMILLGSFLLTMLSACGGKTTDQQLLEQAAVVHQEAIKIEKAMKGSLDSLIQLKNNINIQGRQLTPEELDFVSEVEKLEDSYQYWLDNHVEVPGFEHHSHAGHDHDHGDGAELEVSPKDMLLIQTEFRDSLLSLQQRIKELKGV